MTFKNLIYKKQKALHFLRGVAVFLSLYRKTTSIDKSTHLFLLGSCSILKLISASHLSYLHTALGSAHLRLRWPTELVQRECWPESSRFIVQISKQKNVDGSGLPLNCILGSVFALLCGFSGILWLLGLWAENWFSEMASIKGKLWLMIAVSSNVFLKIFIYLAASGLSRGTWDLALRHSGPSPQHTGLQHIGSREHGLSCCSLSPCPLHCKVDC